MSAVVHISIAVVKHNPKQLEERSLHCVLSVNWPSLKEVGQESWGKGDGGVLLTDFLLKPCSTCFLLVPRTTNWGALTSPNKLNPQKSLIKKVLHGFAHRSIFWRHFLDSDYIFSYTLYFGQVNKNKSTYYLHCFKMLPSVLRVCL